MEKLIRGIHDFQTTHFNEQQEFYSQLSKGQSPETLMITCSDSRIMPGTVTKATPGELFVLRNAGNIVPPYGASSGGEGATIEYAVAALNVSHIIVMGHSHCGAMKGLLNPSDVANLPLVANWLKQAEATRQVVAENYQDCTGIDLLNAAIKENVLVQLDNLRTYPAVAARMAKGVLQLHAWIYEIETGRVLAFDPEELHFAPVTTDYKTKTTSRRQRILAPVVQLERAA
jgi:carbonic anhydrase